MTIGISGGISGAKRGRLAVALMVLCPALYWGAAHAGEVSLTVRPTGDGLALNCVFQFAHWITEESGVVGPGAERVFTLHVAPDDGTITAINASGVAMALERIVCGKADDWQDAQFSLPLEAIRDGGPSLLLVCREADGLVCELTEPGPAP